MWPLKGFRRSSQEQNDILKDRIITLGEVAHHDSSCDCWIVLFNCVYDITSFISLHPGGVEVLLEHGGRDATIAFQEAGHADVSLSIMESYRLGRLPEHEQLNLELVFGKSFLANRVKT